MRLIALIKGGCAASKIERWVQAKIKTVRLAVRFSRFCVAPSCSIFDYTFLSANQARKSHESY